jgi:hypothetical protein
MQTINLYNKFLDEWSDKWFQFIKDNPDKLWNYYYLSKNPNITCKIVQENPDKDWDYCNLSYNPNITWKIVQANPDKSWDYYYLSKNPNNANLWEIVQANPNKPWDYTFLSMNPMNKTRETFIRKRFQEWFIRSDLKWELIATVWHPTNFKKFKYLTPELFEDLENDDDDDDDNL